MGASRDSFIKYPRTPHLFGAKGTDDDKHLNKRDSEVFVRDPSLIVEEKVDGTNVGIHFNAEGRMILQCRGHEIGEGMHPQYDLFKQWVAVKRPILEQMLERRYILFGEWLYARHTIHYAKLPHYFFEFDIYDKEASAFLDWETRMVLLADTGIETVPVVHRGPAKQEELLEMIVSSQFDASFENPITGDVDHRMEGLYLRIESDGYAVGRAKMVRPEFVEKIKQSEHWQHQKMIPNELAVGADIWK